MTTQRAVTVAALTVVLLYAFPCQVMGAGGPDVLWRTNAHAYQVSSLSFSADGSLLASAGFVNDASAFIWRTADGGLQSKISATRRNEEVFSVAFSPTTNLVVAASSNGEFSRVRFVQAMDGTPVWNLISGGQDMDHVWDHALVSPDGLQIALTVDDFYVVVWSAAGGPYPYIGEFYLDDFSAQSPYGWSRDQKYFASMGTPEHGDPYATLWNAQTFTFIRSLDGHCGTASCLAFSPTEDILATGGGDGMIRLWNIPEGTTNRDFVACRNGITTLTYSHDGRLLVCSDGQSIQFWRITDRKLLCTYDEALPGVCALAVSPDNRRFAVGGVDGSVTVARMPLWISDVSLAGGQVIMRWHGGSGLYQVQASTSLLNGSWENVGIPTTNTSSTNTSSATVFLRVESLPSP